MKHFALLTALLLTLISVTPTSAQAKPLGTFGDWMAYVENENGQILCFMLSKPTKAEGKYTKRGDPYFLVSHRPAENRKNEVSVIAGYGYKPGSEATLTVDAKSTFKLFTDGDSAWARDGKGDKDITAAMRRGNKMVVKGSSARGTLTTDTYSLKGVSAAFKAINKACGL